MKLVKSLLLGAPAALLAVSAASAADLPSKKASPVSYVKVCDAYGAGFFYIPGTDTCLKVGGYVRAEYSIQQRGTQATYSQSTGSLAVANSNAEDLTGFRARGRLDLDARTQSAWGTVRTVVGLRLQNQTGVYNNATAIGAQNSAVATTYLSTASAYSSIEAAYIQFAGITAGRAAENFAFMPGSTHFFSGGHQWAGYPNGVKQLAYTATFGGGFSATIALEDRYDQGSTTANVLYNATAGAAAAAAAYPQTMPNIVANLRVDQAWGSAQIAGMVQKNDVVTGASVGLTSVDVSKTGYAIGAGLKINLPMLAAGDQLWLTAAYADGINDATIGTGASTNGLDQFNMLRGFQRGDQSYALVGSNAAPAIQNEKTWSVGGALVHYWAPTWRSIVGASYGNYKPGASVLAATTATGGLSKADVYNVTGSLIWSPVPNFDIGAEVQYRKIKQSIDATNTALAAAGVKVSPSDLGARIRLQRSF